MMDVITIDPSLICTAMVVNDKKFVYVGKHIAYTEKGNLKQWFARFNDVVKIRVFDLKSAIILGYSEHELIKFKSYINIIDVMINDITENVTDLTTAKVGIEGYSYSSISGPLIDLVTFGTIIKYSLLKIGLTNILIVPPQELKSKAGSLAYQPIKKGKIIQYVNSDGKSAGSFKKTDMLKCLLDITLTGSDEWINTLNLYKNELYKLKAVPKPIEDVNDAKLLYEWIIKEG